MKWHRRYKEQKEKLGRLVKERDFWKRVLFLEVENNIADPSGAVSEIEIRQRRDRYEKALQRKLKE